MTSFNRFMRRAKARGKKPGEVTYKCNPRGGSPAVYDKRDFTVENFTGKLFPGSVKGFNPFEKKGGKV